MLTPRRKTFTIVATGLLATAMLVAATRPASACGMLQFEMRARQNSPAQLLVRALGNFERGVTGPAIAYAKRAYMMKTATSQQKAQALTVLAWVAWQRGLHRDAVQALAVARKLSGGSDSIDGVLVRASDRQITAALRKAIAG